MSIAGIWKITEVNAFDKSFKQTWRTVSDLLADSEVGPVQKAMAQACYAFEEDGTFKQLLPKELDKDGEYPAYDDRFVIGNVSKWKEENGRLFAAAVENGEDDWSELEPAGDGYIMFGFHKIVKA